MVPRGMALLCEIGLGGKLTAVISLMMLLGGVRVRGKLLRQGHQL